MDDQARLSDLIPRRLTTFALLFLLGLGIIAGLLLVYDWSLSVAAHTTDGRVAAFDLDGEGSLSVWVSSTLLSLASLLAVLVFSVRRYRTDDYNGRYRVWLWAAACWLLMSIDETASLHEGFKEMMAQATGTRLFGDGSIWWVAPYFFLLAAVGSRLLVDMRECWLSSAALIGTAVSYAVAVAAQLGWVLGPGGTREIMLEEGCELLGDLLLVMAMGLHARHVILDAEGLLGRAAEDFAGDDGAEEDDERLPPRSAVVSKPLRPDFTEVKWRQPDQPHTLPQPATKKAVAPAARPAPLAAAKPASPSLGATAAKPTSPAGGLNSSPVQRKLTKAEKKALRKRLLDMRQAREQGG